MELLEQRILKDGRILPGNVLKVDSFLNHQIDIDLIDALGAEWKRLYANDKITKIATIEASGIGIACLVARHFGVPVVFAKKSKSNNIGNDFYSTEVVSYTHGRAYDVIASKKYINPGDRILLIDDFLANGSALRALIKLAEMGGATVVGAGIAIEKVYQNGGNSIRELGYRIESLARIASMSDDGKIEFC
jgi:xanthine phosphoribosyltransferase